MKKTQSSLKLAAAALVGAAVSGAIGILFAPDSGTGTRDKILAKGEDLTDAMKDKFQLVVDETKKEIAEMKEKGHVFLGDGLAKAEKFNSESKLV